MEKAKMKTKFQKTTLLVGTLFLLVILASFVSAATTLNVPASDSTISGTADLNATSDSLTDMLNCTFYAKSDLTANSTFSSIGTITNSTASATVINGTFDSTILEDANDYQFYAQCFNATDNETSATNTGITVDNTIPQAPSSLDPSDKTTVSSSTTQTFTATVTDENTTSCTYTIARSGATSGSDYESGDATYSGSSCSFTKEFTTTTDNGNWYWTITASDETNTTTSGTNILNVQLPGEGGGSSGGVIDETTGTFTPEQKKGITLFTVVLVIFIVGWVIYGRNH
ncbi:MAG: hypothetical protein ACP5D2_05215 [Candidatus Nanoarchaeia archaeon]